MAEGRRPSPAGARASAIPPGSPAGRARPRVARVPPRPSVGGPRGSRPERGQPAGQVDIDQVRGSPRRSRSGRSCESALVATGISCNSCGSIRTEPRPSRRDASAGPGRSPHPGPRRRPRPDRRRWPRSGPPSVLNLLLDGRAPESSGSLEPSHPRGRRRSRGTHRQGLREWIPDGRGGRGLVDEGDRTSPAAPLHVISTPRASSVGIAARRCARTGSSEAAPAPWAALVGERGRATQGARHDDVPIVGAPSIACWASRRASSRPLQAFGPRRADPATSMDSVRTGPEQTGGDGDAGATELRANRPPRRGRRTCWPRRRRSREAPKAAVEAMLITLPRPRSTIPVRKRRRIDDRLDVDVDDLDHPLARAGREPPGGRSRRRRRGPRPRGRGRELIGQTIALSGSPRSAAITSAATRYAEVSSVARVRSLSSRRATRATERPREASSWATAAPIPTTNPSPAGRLLAEASGRLIGEAPSA